MSLLQSPTGHLTNLSTSPAGTGPGTAEGGETTCAVDLFPSASHPTRQGFVRVINHGDEPGEVRITAFDSSPRSREPVTLSLDAHETAHFNSRDLEDGNAEKGLSGGVGAGEGAWRLELRSDLDFEVLAYIRHGDGFLTSMHDVVPRSASRHRVSTFNPGDNRNQVSQLRLINPGEKTVEVTDRGHRRSGRIAGKRSAALPPGGRGAHVHGPRTGARLPWRPHRLARGRPRQVAVDRLRRTPDPSDEPAREPHGAPDQSFHPTAGATVASNLEPLRTMVQRSRPQALVEGIRPVLLRAIREPRFSMAGGGHGGPRGGRPPVPHSLVRETAVTCVTAPWASRVAHGCGSIRMPQTATRAPIRPTTHSERSRSTSNIARVPLDARGWQSDDGTRADMTMAETVRLLNAHVAPYFRKISEDKSRITFREGSEFEVPGDGSPDSTTQRHREVLGIDCDDYP